jgi:malonyl-CoA O-methyltransferase
MPKLFALQGASVDRMPDAGKIATAFHQKAVEYDHHVLVQKRVVAQLAGAIEQRLNRPPEHILDVGTGTGALLERLHTAYPKSGLTGVDIALNMCLRTRQKLGLACSVVTGAAEHLPFATGTFDLVVSASVLQWVEKISDALYELRRVVQPGGEICLAFFCQGSLAELQHCFRDTIRRFSADSCYSESRLHGFHCVEEVTAIVNKLDFEKVVVTVESEVDWYDDLHTLLRSIKNIGAGTVSGGSGGGLGWRGILRETSKMYLDLYGVNGRIPATYKVIYLTATTRL